MTPFGVWGIRGEAPFGCNFGGVMRPLRRGHVNKHKSAKRFRGNTSRTKSANVRGAPMRGGWRL